MSDIQIPKDTEKPKKDEWQRLLAKQTLAEWEKGQSYVDQMNEMYDDIYRLLRGQRPNKNYDWQSNLSLRKTFQVVWTAISFMSQKMWGATPIIGVEAFNKKGAWQREKLLETWLAKDMYFLVMVQGLLRLLLNGTVIIKKGWRQTLISKEQAMTFDMPVWGSEGDLTFKQGEQVLKATFPKEDRPEDIVLNNRDVVVDWMLKTGQPINEGRFVIHRETLDIGSLYASGIDYINLDEVRRGTIAETTETADHAKLRQSNFGTGSQKSRGTKETPPESDIYKETEIFERTGIMPVKVKGKDIIPLFDMDEIYKEDTEWKLMINAVADKSNPVLIRWEEHPYKEINFIAGQLYLDPERWEGMGMIEPVKDIFEFQDDNMNGMFDEIWKNLMPPVIFNKFAVQEWDSIKWAPSQKWLMQGNPSDNVLITRGSEISRDGWQRHSLLEDEGRLVTSVTPGVQGQDQSKTATQGVLNTQFSTGKLDFLIKMIEVTWFVPSSEMTLRFAQMFAHPLTFLSIIGEPFEFDQFLNEYKFISSLSSVDLPEQVEVKIQQNLQLLQVLTPLLQTNPGVAAMINQIYADILRLRNRPQMAARLDENFFEPQTEAGQLERFNNGLIEPGATSNEQGIPQSVAERSTRTRINNQAGGLLQ